MRRIVPLALFAATIMAGCGGGSTKSTTRVETHRDDQPLPKADYIALGDVICRNHESRTRDLESQTIELGHIDSKGKAHRVAGLLRQQSDNLAAEAQELRGLQSPTADVGTVKSILGLLRAKVDVLREWASAYDDLNTAQIRAFQLQIGAATSRARQAARSYGFEICGGD